MCVLKASRAGAGVRAARVQYDGAHGVAGQHLLAPQHRRRLHPVGGEHAGCGRARPVVDDDSDIRAARLLDAGRDTGGAEALRAGDAHGATPIVVSPAVSASPSMRLASWIAWPAAPLPRLSMAATAIARPARRSAAT